MKGGAMVGCAIIEEISCITISERAENTLKRLGNEYINIEPDRLR